MRYFLIGVLSATICIAQQTKFPELKKAVVVVPVADVVRKPLGDLDEYYTVLDAYKALGYKETDENDMYTRAYQLLFNEVVGIVRETSDEVLIHVPSLFYQKEKGAFPQSAYWIHKSALLSCETLQHHGVDLTKIPPPISIDEPGWGMENKQVVTIVFPFCNPVTCEVYSAGTRFVYKEHDTDNHLFYVYALNSNSMECDILAIPDEICVMYADKPNHEKITDFITLLRSWIQLLGSIPYVWGGSSFTQLIKERSLWKTKVFAGDASYHDYVRIHPEFNTFPYTGFDCSCLIVRAAQICGIPYFLGNSHTIESLLEPLDRYEDLREGDILWIAGHVMLVGSLQDNTLIEARSYGAGWGKLHEAPLKRIFRGIDTYKELLDHITNNKPIFLLHHNGSLRYQIPELKIFSLSQAWGVRKPSDTASFSTTPHTYSLD